MILPLRAPGPSQLGSVERKLTVVVPNGSGWPIFWVLLGGYGAWFGDVGGFKAKAARNGGDRWRRAIGAVGPICGPCRHARWGVDPGLPEQSLAQCAARGGARDR